VDEAAGRPTVSDAPARGLGPVLRFIWRNRMFTPRYWRYGLRYLWLLKVRNRHIRTRGMVFVGKRAELTCTRGLGHMELGRWVWIGDGTAVRCHEGFLRIGDKAVFGCNNTVISYLDVDLGEGSLVADGVYIADFDHRYQDLHVPIRKQGIVTSRVRVGPDCWLGEKATVLRGTNIGEGSVIGAHALVRGAIPPRSVAVGVPARVVKKRSGADVER
jgi:acetyltransferase-like isoleucine patch superfamily enzyme